jgi:hypothetical protein
MGDEFQPASYVTAPQVNVASGVALAIALLNQVPPKSGDGVRASARELRAATQRVQAQWGKQRPRAKVDHRPFDNAADVSWGALAGRLGAQAALPHDRHPRAARAAGLLDRLKLDDLSWLTGKYNEQWSQAEHRLGRVRSEELRGDIDELAGKGFLDEVEHAHKAYGDALGITARHEGADDNVAMVEPLRALCDAVAEYGLQLCAAHRKADAATRREIVLALRPIDEHRVRYARGGASAESEAVTPDTPIPPAE